MIEKILNFSIQYRYLVLMLTFGVAAYGFYAFHELPIDAVPDVTNNQVQINTLVEGYSPQQVEKQVTYLIENALNGIPGLESTRSLSRNGFSQVTAVFQDKVNIYFARQQITERLGAIRESLPPGAEPTMGPISTGLGEIYMWTVDFQHPRGNDARIVEGHPGWQNDGAYLTPEGQRLYTDEERAAYLRTVQDWIIRPQLQSVTGLAGVDSIGGYVMQYHVEPKPSKLIEYGITLHDIVEALENNNLAAGAGFIEQNGEAFLVKTDARINDMQEIGEVVVKTRDSMPIYLKDIADVVIGKEMRSGSSTKNGREVVTGTAMMLIGSNSRTVSQAVDLKLAEINRTLPPDISADMVMNRTKLIDSTIHTVITNLAEGALLVIAVLFLMLGNFRAALITACVIPLSMLITAIGMVDSRISGNLMSLGAIDFGLIVDGAVIIAENCLRRLALKQKEHGRVLTLSERLHEVTLASKEMIQPSVFGQAIIMIVYIPLLTLSGVEGKMFEPMAMTVIFALIAAFILSLTFVPAVIAIFVTGKVQEHENAAIHKSKELYAPVLQQVVNHPLTVVTAAVVLLIGSGYLFTRLGQEFVPTLDEQDIAVQATRAASTSLNQATKMQFEVEKTLLQFPEVNLVYSKTGTAEMASDPMPPDASDTFVMLKPRSEWPNPKLDKSELIAQMEEELRKLPGNNFEFTQPIEMRFNELIAGVKSDVAVKVYGDDFSIMHQTAVDIAKVLKQIPGAADIIVDKTDGLPIMEVNLKRGPISRHGLSVRDVLDVVQVAVGGGHAGELFEGDRRFDIVVKLAESDRQNIATLENLPVVLPNRKESEGFNYVPLKQVADFNLEEGLNQIGRENGKRLVLVQANVRGSDLGTFVEAAKKEIAAKVIIPPGYWIAWGGQFEHLMSARDRLLIVVPICFFLILVLLFTAFNSFKYALLVFSGVPLALTGGIAALWLRDMPFSISAAVGFIALSGIAVLNGLVMVTYINQLREEGKNPEQAINEGALTRLRPVLVTALVASLGFLPMALATGAGAEVQKPLATVVIGGLISSTFLTLLVLPALYRLFSREKKLFTLGKLQPAQQVIDL
jgi:cobalt-zinc-cadmium resistance protein CzcA